ncbi:MAG: inositol-3-phosphate synthase [Thermodesulfovibrionales bacterium]|nr:inositol-3-phosphate synthase [Thermodesulfovibrionales bacterium]
MGKIRIAIAGIGNCASSLIQGIEYYKSLGRRHPDRSLGLMHYELGGYTPDDIEIVAAFDIDKRKVGKPLNEAVFAKPNCTKTFNKNLPHFKVTVNMGEVLDGVSRHLKDYPEERRFIVSNKKPCDVAKTLKQSGADMLLSYLPVGSDKATAFYAEACLKTGVSLVNCVPVFIASSRSWAKRFEEKNIPIIGDDIKSQIGATIIHRMLTKLFIDRGVKIDNTYQLNVGGNTDFLNMLNHTRLKSKKISKTEAVQSQLANPLNADNIHIGPSDYIPWLKDNKVCFLRMEGRGFGNIPVNFELRLSVEDSPNSAGVVIDAIRCCKIARDRGTGGVLISPSAYFMKHPIKQFSDEEARNMLEEFIAGKRNK